MLLLSVLTTFWQYGAIDAELALLLICANLFAPQSRFDQPPGRPSVSLTALCWHCWQLGDIRSTLTLATGRPGYPDIIPEGWWLRWHVLAECIDGLPVSGDARRTMKVLAPRTRLLHDENTRPDHHPRLSFVTGRQNCGCASIDADDHDSAMSDTEFRASKLTDIAANTGKSATILFYFRKAMGAQATAKQHRFPLRQWQCFVDDFRAISLIGIDGYKKLVVELFRVRPRR